MSLKVKTLRQVWKRLYSTLSRKPSFAKSNLIMGQKRPSGIGSTLWGYFNYPGNVMFVTTNIFSFAALVTYNTMATIRHDQILEQEMLAAQLLTSPSTEHMMISPHNDEKVVNDSNNHFYNNIPKHTEVLSQPKPETILTQFKRNILKHIKEKVTTQQKQVVANESVEIVESPLSMYSPSDVVLESQLPVNNLKSLTATASLFSLFYSYHLYESIVKDDWQHSKKEALETDRNYEWNEEVKRVGHLILPTLENFQKIHTTLTTFYQVWNEDNKRQIEQVDKVFNFKFPGWRIYPYSLSKICQQLHDNNIKTVKDFQTFYDSINDKNLKRLCRLWLLDHSNLFGKSNEYVLNEYFFNKLISDSIQNRDLTSFKRYSSLILNPNNNKTNLFFPLQPRYMSPQVHLDTLLAVFKNYILLQEGTTTQYAHFDKEILRMVQLIKNHGYLDKNGNAHILLQDDHPPVPEPERKLYFENISKNKTLGELLYEVSQLQYTSTD